MVAPVVLPQPMAAARRTRANRSAWTLHLRLAEVAMKNVILNLPTLGFVIVTRAALAAGIGLLVASKMPDSRRRAIGRTLLTIGAVTTIPALLAVRRQGRAARA